METLVIVVHVLAALAMIGLILLQQGKGAEMGASFGAGGSQTLFGSRGSGNIFSRATAVIAAVFFATSFSLAIIAKNRANVEDGFDISVPTEEVQTSQEVTSDVPAVEVDSEVESDVPMAQDSPGETSADTTSEEVPSAEEVPSQSEEPPAN